MKRTTVTLASGTKIVVSSIPRGGILNLNRDEACLFGHRNGQDIWQNDDLPSHLTRYSAHDDLVAAVAADPASFIPEPKEWY